MIFATPKAKLATGLISAPPRFAIMRSVRCGRKTTRPAQEGLFPTRPRKRSRLRRECKRGGAIDRCARGNALHEDEALRTLAIFTTHGGVTGSSESDTFAAPSPQVSRPLVPVPPGASIFVFAIFCAGVRGAQPRAFAVRCSRTGPVDGSET